MRVPLHFSKPQSSSFVSTPVRHSESPLCCVTSTTGSIAARNAASAAVSGTPPGFTGRNMMPFERFELCGIASTSQPLFRSRHCAWSAVQRSLAFGCST